LSVPCKAYGSTSPGAQDMTHIGSTGLIVPASSRRADSHDHDEHDDHDHDHDHDDHDHGHDEGEGLRACGCFARDEGWTFNCSDTARLRHEFSVLTDSDRQCLTSCAGVTGCRDAYFYVQAHHDYCPPSVVPTDVAHGIHAFEEGCDECFVRRAVNESLPECPDVSCSDGAGANAAIATLEQGGCSLQCNAAACAEPYRRLRAWHDTCPEEGPVEAVEAALHEFEDSCAAMECNADSDHHHGDEDEDHDHDDHDHDEYDPMQCDGAPPTVAPIAGALGGLLLVGAIAAGVTSAATSG